MSDLILQISKIIKKISTSSGCSYLYKYFDELVATLDECKNIGLSKQELDILNELIMEYASESLYNNYDSANWRRYYARCFYCADYLVHYFPEDQVQKLERFLNRFYFVDLIEKKVAPIIPTNVFSKYLAANITPENHKIFLDTIIRSALSDCGIKWSNRRGFPNYEEITLSLEYAKFADFFIREFIRIDSDYSKLKEWLPLLDTKQLADFWYKFPNTSYFEQYRRYGAEEIVEISDKILDIHLGLFSMWYWHDPHEVIECLPLEDLIEILEVLDDDEFEKLLRHIVTLPFNEKVKCILEHFTDDDEMSIVRLSKDLLQQYHKS